MTNKEIVQNAFENFSKGNIPAILEVLSDDVSWEMNGPNFVPYFGSRKGKEQVADFFTQIATTSDFKNFEPQVFIAEGDKVAATGIAIATNKLTGKTSNNHWAMEWTFKDGKVTHYRNYSDSYDIAQSFMN